MMKEFTIRNEVETGKFGKRVAKAVSAGDVIGLFGELGTGKTTLTGYIAEGLGISGRVTSPTFTIVNEYYDGKMPVFHFDAYRLADSREFLDAGLDEYFFRDGICIIEWADRIADILPDDTKCLFLSYGSKEGERKIGCTFLE